MIAHADRACDWYGLGLARLALAELNVLAREGPLLPIGMNNEAGAEHALMQALVLDPSLNAAADLLALAPTIREGSARLRERNIALRPVHHLLSGPGAAAAAYAEREAGSVDTAVALERRALQLGGIDSAAVMLALARDLYRLGNADGGKQLLIDAASHTATPPSDSAYRQELAWVASPAELSQWDSVPVADRAAWVRRFWSTRDIAEGRSEGERLVEHYRRIEYAMKNFRLRLPRFGRSVAVTTTPSSADGYLAESLARQEILHSASAFPDASSFLRAATDFGSESPMRYYHSIQDVVSDKGVIWIRHGPPTKIAHNVTGPPYEIWRYDRPEGPLILYFREVDALGSAMPNELVPTILDASPVVRAQVCALDQELCPRTSTRLNFDDHPLHSTLKKVIEDEIHSAHLTPDVLLRSANHGKAFIDLATTTDSYHRDFARTLHPALQLLGLGQAPGWSPRLVLAFALPGSELAAEPTSSATLKTVYAVHIRLTAIGRDGAAHEIDTVRRFAAGAPLAKGQFLTGLLQLQLPSGEYAASAVFTQTAGQGAVASLPRIRLSSNGPTLQLSDLVLGRDPASVRWNSGTTDVALNPLNTWPRGGNAEIYFQLSGLTPGARYDTRYEIFRAADDSTKRPRLAVSSSATASEPRLEVSRTLGLQNLDPGRYRLKLTVASGGTATTSIAWLTIVK